MPQWTPESRPHFSAGSYLCSPLNPFTWELNVPIHTVCQKAPHRAFNLHIGFLKPYIELCDGHVAAKWLPLCRLKDNCFCLFILRSVRFHVIREFWMIQYSHFMWGDMLSPLVYGGGGNGQIHPFFHKCFHFKTSWGSWRQLLCSSILRQAACCYLINTGARIHQWITSRVSRPSAASAQHIFWRAVPL